MCCGVYVCAEVVDQNGPDLMIGCRQVRVEHQVVVERTRGPEIKNTNLHLIREGCTVLRILLRDLGFPIIE